MFMQQEIKNFYQKVKKFKIENSILMGMKTFTNSYQ